MNDLYAAVWQVLLQRKDLNIFVSIESENCLVVKLFCRTIPVSEERVELTAPEVEA